MMKTPTLKNAVAMAVLASFAATSVAEVAIEEIVVSARKRAENLQLRAGCPPQHPQRAPA